MTSGSFTRQFLWLLCVASAVALLSNAEAVSEAELKEDQFDSRLQQQQLDVDSVERLYLDLLARRTGELSGSRWSRGLLKRLQAAAAKKRNELPPISTLRFG